MHFKLNRALVSSFLSVSAVLAGEPEDNIAGVMKMRSMTSIITTASGTFTMPKLQGNIGSGVVIGVGLDGLTCATASLAAGVQLKKGGEDRFYVAAWAQFGPYSIFWRQPDPLKPFTISFGEKIKVTVTHKGTSRTRGGFTIQNLNHKDMSWSGDVGSESSDSYQLCGDNAYWAVGIVGDGSLTPLAAFEDVVFTNLYYFQGGKNYYPSRGSLFVNPFLNIKESGVERTSVEVQDSPSSVRVTVKSRAWQG